MGVRTFYGKEQRQLYRAASRVVRGNVTISGIPNRLNTFVTCIVGYLHNVLMWPPAS